MNFNNRNPILFLLVLLTAILTIAAQCGPNAAPPPDSDSGQSWKIGGQVPVDTNVYIITGKVTAEVEEKVRQTETARGSSTIYGNAGQVHSRATFFGPEFGGKGFVRLKVHNVNIEQNSEIPTPSQASTIAPIEQIILIKTADTKAGALLPGDVVTFKCRAQYEAVAPILNQETFDDKKSDQVATWEVDYCRMELPLIKVPKAPSMPTEDGTIKNGK